MLGDRRRIIPVLLVAVTVVPASLLVWLGVRSAAQERDLDRQRRREALEVAAGRVAISIERGLAALEERLAAGFGMALTQTGLQSGSDLSAPMHQPDAVSTEEPQTDLFSSGEELELRRRDLAGAARLYDVLARSPDFQLRPGAAAPSV